MTTKQSSSPLPGGLPTLPGDLFLPSIRNVDIHVCLPDSAVSSLRISTLYTELGKETYTLLGLEQGPQKVFFGVNAKERLGNHEAADCQDGQGHLKPEAKENGRMALKGPSQPHHF